MDFTETTAETQTMRPEVSGAGLTKATTASALQSLKCATAATTAWTTEDTNNKPLTVILASHGLTNPDGLTLTDQTTDWTPTTAETQTMSPKASGAGSTKTPTDSATHSETKACRTMYGEKRFVISIQMVFNQELKDDKVNKNHNFLFNLLITQAIYKYKL